MLFKSTLWKRPYNENIIPLLGISDRGGGDEMEGSAFSGSCLYLLLYTKAWVLGRLTGWGEEKTVIGMDESGECARKSRGLRRAVLVFSGLMLMLLLLLLACNVAALLLHRSKNRMAA
jgi:hypothetical protein